MKAKSCILGEITPYRLEATETENSFAEKVLGDKSTSCQQHTPCSKDNCKLGCISKSVASRPRGAILPFHLALVGPHLKDSAQLWDCLYKTDINILE